MKTFTIIVVLIMAALIGLTVYLSFQIDSPADEVEQGANNEVEQNEENELPDNWQSYSNSEFDFTFLYPAGAVASVDGERAKVTVLGADNAANSEITDGFIFYVETEDIPEDTSLAEFATTLYAEKTVSLEGVAEPSIKEVNGEMIYEFKVETELGTIATYAVLEADASSALVVEYLISGAEGNSYQSTVDIMLGSFELSS